MHEPEAGGGKPGESSRKPQKQNTLDYGKGEATPKNAVKDRKNGEQAKGKKIMLAAEEEVREEDYGKYSSSSKGPEEKTRSAPKKEGNKQASEQKTSPMSKIGDVKKRHDDGVGAAAKKDSTSDAAAKKDRKGVEAKKANKETTEKKDAKSKKAEKEQPKDAKSKKAEKEKQKTKEPQEKAASKTKATPPKRDAAKTPKDKKDNNDKEDAKLKKRQRVDEKAEKEKEGLTAIYERWLACGENWKQSSWVVSMKQNHEHQKRGCRSLQEDEKAATTVAVAQARKKKIQIILQLIPSPEAAGLFFFEKHPAGKPLTGAKLGPPLETVKREHVCLVLHTSGTTKKPKIVPITHESMAIGGMCHAAANLLGPEDVFVNTMPMFHIAGLMENLLMSAYSGAKFIALPGQYQAHTFFEAMKKEPLPTSYSAVPAHHMSLMSLAKEAKNFVSPLKVIRNDSAALLPSLAEQMEDFFQASMLRHGAPGLLHDRGESAVLQSQAKTPRDVGEVVEARTLPWNTNTDVAIWRRAEKVLKTLEWDLQAKLDHVSEATLASPAYITEVLGVLDVLAGEKEDSERRRAVRAALFEGNRKNDESLAQYALRRESQFEIAGRFLSIPEEIKGILLEEQSGLSKQSMQSLRVLTKGQHSYSEVKKALQVLDLDEESIIKPGKVSYYGDLAENEDTDSEVDDEVIFNALEYNEVSAFAYFGHSDEASRSTV
eukprot:g28961.t1